MAHHLDPEPEDPSGASNGHGTASTPRGVGGGSLDASLDRDMAAHYPALRSIARRAVERVPGGRALDPTELVHEGYLRLRRSGMALPPRRTEFLALVATVLRNCLVDHVRELRALKRGGDAQRVTLTGLELATKGEVDVLELDEALQRLAALDRSQAQIVELKYFGGLSFEEIAELLAISVNDVRSDWTLAKAWLHRELRG